MKYLRVSVRIYFICREIIMGMNLLYLFTFPKFSNCQRKNLGIFFLNETLEQTFFNDI